jgi:thioredoxin 1
MLKLLKFSSKTCQPCIHLEPIYNSVINSMPDINSFKIDIQDYPSETIKYNVRGVPTIVILKNDIEVGRITGYIGKEALEQKIKQYK